jgi:SAM-dependent methyltransferase
MDQNKIWSYFQSEGVDVFSDSLPRLRYLAHQAKTLVKCSGPITLNIGVGNGWLEDQLIHEGWRIRSLDPNRSSLKRLKTKSVIANVGLIEALPYKSGIFDVVFCSEVLEHLSERQLDEGVKEVFRVLKPGGYFLGTVPHKENLEDNKVVCPDCGKIFHRWGHQQNFDETKLAALFQQGMTLLLKRRLFVSWRGLNLKRRVAAFIKLWLFYLGSHGSNEALYFQVRK